MKSTPGNMANIRDLHQAIINYNVADAERIANELRKNNVSISSEIAFAKMLLKIKGSHYETMIEALSN